MIDAREIRDLGLFERLYDDHLAEIAKITERRSYDTDFTLYMSRDRAIRIFIVNKGRVSLHLFASEGKPGKGLGMCKKGDLFGGASFFNIQKHSVTAICMEDTELFVIESSRLLELFDKYPEIGYRFMTELAQIYFDRFVNVRDLLVSTK